MGLQRRQRLACQHLGSPGSDPLQLGLQPYNRVPWRSEAYWGPRVGAAEERAAGHRAVPQVVKMTKPTLSLDLSTTDSTKLENVAYLHHSATLPQSQGDAFLVFKCNPPDSFSLSNELSDKMSSFKIPYLHTAIASTTDNSGVVKL